MPQKVKSDVAARVSQEIDKAMRLSGRGLHDAAWEVLKRADQVAHNANLASGYLYWGLAATADERHDAESAVRYIMKALQLDPAAPPFIGSYNIIRERVVATFRDLDVADQAIPTFFRLLADLDAVNSAALLKYSQYLAAEGDQEASLGLAQDAVDREPRNAKALRHLARLLAGAGRHQEARDRRVEADAIAQIFPCPEARA